MRTNTLCIAFTTALFLTLSPDRARATQVVALGYNLGPVPESLTNAVAVSVVGYSIAALRADGTVAQWGNTAGDPGVSNLVTISTGWAHGIGQRADGSITGWGDDSFGEITAYPPAATNATSLVAAST